MGISFTEEFGALMAQVQHVHCDKHRYQIENDNYGQYDSSAISVSIERFKSRTLGIVLCQLVYR